MAGTISVVVEGDELDEFDEQFQVLLSNPSGGAVFADNLGLGTIADDDDMPTVSHFIAPAGINEIDDPGLVLDAVFNVQLDNPSGKEVRIDWQTEASGEFAATSPDDFFGATGTVIFYPGETLKSIAVQVRGDALDEHNETFDVVLTDAENAMLDTATRAAATIIDNDLTPLLAISDASIVEGNSGDSDIVFDLTLSWPSGRKVTVDYSVDQQTATHLDDYFGYDYQAEIDALATKAIPEGASYFWLKAERESSIIRPRMERIPYSEQSIARGRELFLSEIAKCSTCHGKDGRGRPLSKPDVWNQRARSTDLTKGIYRGGDGPEDLYRRIVGGIEGRPMSKVDQRIVSKGGVWDLVNYLYSLRPAELRNKSVAARRPPPRGLEDEP